MRKNLNVFILLIFASLSACQETPGILSIDGVWKSADDIIMITSNEDYYIIDSESEDRVFILKSDHSIEMLEGNILIESSDGLSKQYSKSPADQELLPWAITSGMTREFILDHFRLPDTTIITKTGAEKWFYSGNNVIIFDDKSVIKVDANYFAQRDFSLLEVGMSKNKVLSMIGNPDRINRRETKWSYGLDYQVLFREGKLKEVREVNTEFSGYLSWREEALATFDDENLVKRDIDYIQKPTTDLPLNADYFYDSILKVYGVPEKKNDYLPLIIIG